MTYGRKNPTNYPIVMKLYTIRVPKGMVPSGLLYLQGSKPKIVEF